MIEYILIKMGMICQTGCENTAEATLAGLAAGMTAVELDISMSQDKVTLMMVMMMMMVMTVMMMMMMMSMMMVMMRRMMMVMAARHQYDP